MPCALIFISNRLLKRFNAVQFSARSGAAPFTRDGEASFCPLRVKRTLEGDTPCEQIPTWGVQEAKMKAT